VVECRHNRFADRRPGLVPGRRFALVLAVAIAASASVASVAAAADPPIISATIYSSKPTTSESASQGDLQQNCQEDPSSIREQGPGGSTTENFSTYPGFGAWALGTLLSCLNPSIPIDAVTGLTVLNGGSPESELSRADLGSPSDFEDAEQPIVSFNGGAVQYDRPPRNASDLNQEDQVLEPGGEPLSVEVFEGQQLTVTARASTDTITPGKTINFTALETPTASGLSWTWSFGDGETSTEENPQAVAFPTQGLFDVIVQVTDHAGGVGQASIPINVQAPGVTITPGTHHHDGGGTRPGGSRYGPTGSGGTSPGAITGSTTTPNNDNGKSGSNGTNGNNKSGAHNANTASTGGSHKKKTSSNGKGTKSSHSSSTTKHHSTVPVNAPKNDNLPLSEQTKPVDGLLVSDVTPLPPGASPLVHFVAPPLATATPLRSAVSAPVLPIVGAAAAVLLLLTLGAARELRGRRAWRTLRLGS
jgi:PKD domain